MSTALGSTSGSLISGLRRNDAQAWERLVDLYGPLVHSWCRRSNLSDADIADVFQEVFRTVANSLDRFRRDQQGDTFRGWLRTITRTRIVDLVRRREREPVGAGGSSIQRRMQLVPELEAPASSVGIDPATRALLARALSAVQAAVKARTFQAFQMTAVQGRPTEDVAAELGMSVGAVRVAKCRVLQRLRVELGETSAG
ncbi:MAG: sigma-70 family RNA polymerase sigma factor [Planctomycetota bacterium]|nr:sigma-70 family RNA polymerase sigma factor [Planctomycetota bacterium]